MAAWKAETGSMKDRIEIRALSFQHMFYQTVESPGSPKYDHEKENVGKTLFQQQINRS